MTVQTDVRLELARQLRVDSIRAAATAGSGHPTSSLSAADLMAVLLSGHLRYDFANPGHPSNDHLIFSKGHASPLLYAMYRAVGAISDEELRSYRRFGSRLQGHPTPALPWVDVATGSLGQGLPIGVGIALAGKYLDQLPYRTWVLCGDSEMAEGSMWESFDKAGYYELDNLTALLDLNRLGQTGPTAHGWNSRRYAERARAFGWEVIEVDGHDLHEIDQALADAGQPRKKPALVIATTRKGRGVSFLEDAENWHGKPTTDAQTSQALAELGGESNLTIATVPPEDLAPTPLPEPDAYAVPDYEVGSQVATRQAYGETLRALGSLHPKIVGLDGEVSNSTKADVFAAAHSRRYFELFIAEQQMVATAVGLAIRGYRPFASSFAAFLSRAYDFIRMAGISQVAIGLCGSHAGVSIGEDGPSQMGLEDIAMLRAIYDSTVLYPCDANQTGQLLSAMVDRPGISYLRTTRGKTPVIYNSDERFNIGGSRVLRESAGDRISVIAAGITVHEALQAADELQANGIMLHVIDAYSVKPLDVQTIADAVRQTAGRVIIIEDHRPEGGLGSAVLEALSSAKLEMPALRVKHLAVRNLPGSGSPAELIDAAGISARHIALAAHELLG